MPPSFDVSIRNFERATAKNLERVLQLRALQRETSCELEITSKGGDVNHGLRMIQFIRDSPLAVNATVVTEAGSMAAVILQCCKIRRIMSNATLHYHYASWRISLMVYFDAELAERNRLSGIKLQNDLIEPIKKRLKITEEDVHKLLREDRKMNAQEALARGHIDEIVDCPVFSRHPGPMI